MLNSRCIPPRTHLSPPGPRSSLTTQANAPWSHWNRDDISPPASHCHRLRWTSRANINAKDSTYLAMTCGGGVAYDRLGTTTLGDTGITREAGDCNLTELVRATAERAAFRREGFLEQRENILRSKFLWEFKPRGGRWGVVKLTQELQNIDVSGRWSRTYGIGV